jgi:hypothetical protein
MPKREKKTDIWGIIVYVLGISAIIITVTAILYMVLR